MEAAALIRDTRLQAGLTQASLAERLGVKQSVIARLERPGSNPTLATIERALESLGHRLVLQAEERGGNVDESLIERNLELTPAQRLAAFEGSHANVAEFASKARRSLG